MAVSVAIAVKLHVVIATNGAFETVTTVSFDPDRNSSPYYCLHQTTGLVDDIAGSRSVATEGSFG